MPKPQGTLEEQAVQARDQFMQQLDISARIEHLLDGRVDSMIMAVLGFDRQWHSGNRWEIDHCNGRAGNSFIGEEIATKRSKRSTGIACSTQSGTAP